MVFGFFKKEEINPDLKWCERISRGFMKTLLTLLLLIPSLSWSYDKEEPMCISVYSFAELNKFS